MEDVVDLMATGAKASEVSDRMKELLYAKGSRKS